MAIAACHPDSSKTGVATTPRAMSTPAATPAAVAVASRHVALSDPGSFRLPHTFEPRAYRVRIALDPAKPRFDGSVEIDGDLSEPVTSVWLDAVDLDVREAHATSADGSVPLVLGIADGRVALIADKPLRAGRWTVAVTYAGTISDPEPIPEHPGPMDRVPIPSGMFRSVLGLKTFWFTNSEPIGARRIFPCIDEPDRKVPWQLTLDYPEGYTALANAPVASEHVLAGGRRRTEFAPTLPLPSYLVAFAVGPFTLVDGGTTKHGTSVQLAITHGDAALAKRVAMTAVRILDLYDEWFELPYAYGKLDLVAVPELHEAMENPGIITFDADMFDSGSTWSYVLAHELAHQWFGDLVTPKWWDDLWLNEHFAAWMAKKVALDPERIVVHDAGDPYRGGSRWRALRVAVADRAALSQTGFEALVDPWAEAILDAMERYVGAEPLRRAIHGYLAAHANGSVTSEDFVAAIASVAGEDIAATVNGLVTGKRAAISMNVECKGKKVTLDAYPGPGSPPVKVCYAYDRNGKRADDCRTIARSEFIPLDTRACPTWFVPDPEGIALADVTREHISDRAVSALTDAETRVLLRYAPELPLRVALIHHMLEHGDVRSMNEAAAHVIEQRAFLPADLRAALDSWLLKKVVQRAGRHVFGGDREQLQLDELLAISGEPERRQQALDHLEPTSSLERELEKAAVAVAMTDPDRRATLLQAVADPRGFIISTTLPTLPDAFDIVADHADARWAAGGPWLLAHAPCDAHRREELVEKLERAFSSHAAWTHDGLRNVVDICATRSAELEPLFRAWLAPTRAPK
jgi:cytosol alanyl aminopeptidase